MLAAGLLPMPDFVSVLARVSPILIFVIAMTIVTELSYQAGLFNRITERIAVFGRGSILLLWVWVVALSVLSTIFLSLDTTAVLVTPVVALLAMRAGLRALPFVLTTVWLANTASLLLPISNLTNLLARQKLQQTPWEFAALVWAPALVGILVPVLLLWLFFRRDLAGRYPAQPPAPVPDRTLLVISAVTVAVLVPALVSGVLVAIPASAAAVVLLVAFAARRPRALSPAMLPWRPVALALGLFLLVAAAHAHGLGAALASATGTGESFPDLLRLAGIGALGANGINNLPAYLALEPTAGSPLRLASLLIGVNLGPLISPWASLATLLWYERLRTLGLRISWAGFALAGVLVLLCTVPAATAALWLAHR